MSSRVEAVRPILVTGGSGQVGSELTRLFSPEVPVIAPNRSELDLSSESSIRAVLREVRPALILNAGAYTAVDQAEGEPDICHAVNAEAPGIIAGCARDMDAALIHYSTDYVFDGSKPGPYAEDDAANPLNTYGRTKAIGEENVRSRGGAAIILRCSWVYSMLGRNFLTTMLRLAEKPLLSVVDDQVGAPTWAAEIAASTYALVQMANRSPAGLRSFVEESAGTYHLSAAGRTTWKMFAEEIFRAAGGAQPEVRGISTEEYAAPARRPKNSLLDNAKIARTFGIRMPSWEAQLGSCLVRA